MLTSLEGSEKTSPRAPAQGTAPPSSPREPSSDKQPEEARGNQDLALRRRIATLERELAAARLAAAPVEAPVVITPEPPTDAGVASGALAFPQEVPAAYTPRAFERVALEAAKTCGMGLDVFAVDCSEFPCIAWTRARDPEVKQFTMDGCGAWTEAFKGTLVFGGTGTNAAGEQERYFGWMPAPPDKDLMPTVFQRGQQRAREMKEALGLK